MKKVITDSEPEPSAPASTVDTPADNNDESYPASRDGSDDEADEEVNRPEDEDEDVPMEVSHSHLEWAPRGAPFTRY